MLRTINFKSPAKEKERRKRKSVEAERRRRKKKATVAFLVFIMATLTTKNCSTEEVNLAVTFSKSS